MKAAIYSEAQARQVFERLWSAIKAGLNDGRLYTVALIEQRRTLSQNAAQWPILRAFSRQLQWPVNGALIYMSEDDWKDVLTAAFNQEQVRLARGLDGGVVMLGLRTSRISKPRFSEWLDFLHATAVARGVDIDGELDER